MFRLDYEDERGRPEQQVAIDGQSEFRHATTARKIATALAAAGERRAIRLSRIVNETIIPTSRLRPNGRWEPLNRRGESARRPRR